MIKIKDRMLLGALSGALASIPARALARWSYRRGLTNIRYDPLAVRLFLPKKHIHSKQAKRLGTVINSINTGATGVLMTYLLSATGKDKAVVKGMGLGAMFWIMVEGVIGSQVLKVKAKKPEASAIGLSAHLLYGALCASLISTFGDPKLFPSVQTQEEQSQIPLIHTGMNAQADERARLRK